jgi:hypothetical protein
MDVFLLATQVWVGRKFMVSAAKERRAVGGVTLETTDAEEGECGKGLLEK